MIRLLLHLLIHNVLQNQQSPLTELGGDHRHNLGGLVKVMELPRQLLHLDIMCKLPLKSLHKVLLGHHCHRRCPNILGNLFLPVLCFVTQQVG